MDQTQSQLAKIAQTLGYAGLLPQTFCVALLWGGDEYRWFALTGGFGYAAMIFSFLGGIWWGQAVSMSETRLWVYVAAIIPSLIAFCLYMPWALGWEWPGPQLITLGAALIGSPVVDRRIGYARPDWLRLRWHLSIGLGVMTIILGCFA